MAEYASSIEIDAPPATVFDYLITNEFMTTWMGQHADLEPHPGGRFAVDIAGHAIRGQYLQVERPTRVVVSWGVLGSTDLPAGASTVEFRLTETDGGTRVDLIHSGLPETELLGHADGWEHFLPRLSIAAPGGDAGPDHWQPIGGWSPPTTIDEGAHHDAGIRIRSCAQLSPGVDQRRHRPGDDPGRRGRHLPCTGS